MIFQPLKIPTEKAAEVVKSYQERVNGCPVILLHEKVTDNADGLYNPILDVACSHVSVAVARQRRHGPPAARLVSRTGPLHSGIPARLSPSRSICDVRR